MTVEEACSFLGESIITHSQLADWSKFTLRLESNGTSTWQSKKRVENRNFGKFEKFQKFGKSIFITCCETNRKTNFKIDILANAWSKSKKNNH